MNFEMNSREDVCTLKQVKGFSKMIIFVFMYMYAKLALTLCIIRNELKDIFEVLLVKSISLEMARVLYSYNKFQKYLTISSCFILNYQVFANFFELNVKWLNGRV